MASFFLPSFSNCNIRGEVSLQTRSLGADCLQVSLMSDLVSKVAQAQTGGVTAWFKKKVVKSAFCMNVRTKGKVLKRGGGAGMS